MRTIVARVASICILVISTVIYAAPFVVVDIARDEYESGDTIEVFLSAINDSEDISVDVYVGLILPSGSIWSYQYDGWSSSIEPWIMGIFVPAWFDLPPTSFWMIDLPSASPPIDVEGDYSFAALLTYPGTFEWVANADLAPFKYGSGTGPSTDITMVTIPSGEFVMGSPFTEPGRDDDEAPPRTVKMSAFQISQTEITQAQWEKVMGWNDSWFDGADQPVERVTWFDCASFCNEMSQMAGAAHCYQLTNLRYDGNHIIGADVTCDYAADGYRLPTAAEWEYACRDSMTTRFYWGDSSSEDVMKQYCWYDKNAYNSRWTEPHAEFSGPQPVGQLIPTTTGLYDMSGNISEWCTDWYAFNYYNTRPNPDENPTGPETGDSRVIRGGAWDDYDTRCRSANRGWLQPEYRNFSIGFRIARRSN
ncbi:MAG: formylglycine-generating enzyme family protein [Candidatus Coatesbacteria bacterium]|nr:formylglycine-generating enzyme family protein [Candidatus Coatesbacteria bacterium]